MYRYEFEKKYLNTHTIPQATLLYGESPFLIEFYTQKILNELHCKEDELKKFYFDEYDFKEIYSLIGSQSLFAERNILLLKIDKKIPKKELKEFWTRLQKATATYLIVAFYQAENRDAKTYSSDCKELEGGFKQGVSVRFFHPKPQEAIVLLREIAKTLALQIEDRLLLEIFRIQNGDFMLITGELQKLATLGCKIEMKEIQNLIFGAGRWEVEDLCVSLFQNRTESLSILERLYELGSEAREIVHGMEEFFRKLFLIYAYRKIYGQENFVEILGYLPPVNIQQQYAQLASRLKGQQYLQIFEILQKAFLLVQQKGSDPLKELYSALIKLQVVFS